MRKALLWTCAVSLLFSLPLAAQERPAPQQAEIQSNQASSEAARSEASQQIVRTFYLSNAPDPARLQDVVNAMRTILQFSRVQPIPALSAVVVRGNPEQIAMAEKLIRDIDKPKPEPQAASYRLEFALSDVENGRKVATRTYAVVVQRASDVHRAEFSKYRAGSRIPIVAGAPAQVQYQDVGVSIDCRLYGPDDSLTLESTVEVSSAGKPQTAQNSAGHPVVRQTKSTSNVTLPVGRPLVLASLDGADSPQRLEIEVTATRLK